MIDGITAMENYPEIRRRGIIEVGCGSGAVILTIIDQKAFNIAIDRNLHAAYQTLENAKINGISIPIVVGDKLTPFRKGSLPPTVLFNPPYLPEDPEQDKFLRDTELLALIGGKRGDEIAWSLLGEIEPYQDSFVIFSTIAVSLSEINQISKAKKLEAKLVRSKSLGLETLLLINFKIQKELP